MVYLDTHLVAWLYDGKVEILSERVVESLENEGLLISPMVMLELQYLFEIGKLKVRSTEIFADLEGAIGLEICEENFEKIVRMAISETWTRDPFDRVITAQARLAKLPLITKDSQIRKHYTKGFW